METAIYKMQKYTDLLTSFLLPDDFISDAVIDTHIRRIFISEFPHTFCKYIFAHLNSCT